MNSLKSRKIAILAPSAPPLGGGGVSSAHFNLYKILKRIGYDIYLITFGDEGDPTDEEEIVRFGSSPRLRWLINLGIYFYLKSKGSKKLAYQVSDILTLVPGALKVNRYLRVLKPDVVILPDHGAPGLFISKRNCKLFLVSHHNPARFVGNPLVGDFCPIDARIAVNLEQRVLRKIDGVICPSEYMRKSFQSTFQFTESVAVIPNLVDAAFVASVPGADLRKQLDLDDAAPLIFIPSAGSRPKGARFVYEIVRRLTAAYGRPLGFYLSGAIENELQMELRHAPANARLFAPGHVNYGENLAYMKTCSFGVSPTLIENFSMAILEANYCRLPMVVFDVGGNREIVSPGENGFLAPYLDVEALIAAAVSLLDQDRLVALRARTLAAVEKKFQYPVILEQLVRFLHQ